MGGCNPIMDALEEETLIAAARLILRTLDSNKIITKEARKILVDLGTRLSSMAKIRVPEDEDEPLGTRLGNPEPIPTSLDIGFRRRFRFFMPSLEFRHTLVNNRQNIEPEHLSFRSDKDDGAEEHPDPVVSVGDDSVEIESISRGAEVFIMDLVNPREIPDLKSISGGERSHAFISARKDALDDCLFILDIENLSIEDVLKLEWVTLNSKISRWTKGVRIFVRIYLASEKLLCEQIFGQGEMESVSLICFSESSEASMLQMLNLAEAVAVSPHQPEKLFSILDMHETLTDVMPDIESLYSGEAGSCIKRECQDVLTRVGDCIKATFIMFKNTVRSKTSYSAFPGGGIHPATVYAMDFIITLTEYSNSLHTCLRDNGVADDLDSSSSCPGYEDDSIVTKSSSPMALHFRSLISILECNLEESSKLYKDDALGHLFMMNNIQYMAEKARYSELRNVLGDEWLRKHNIKFQQYAWSYERATWSLILKFLRDDGLNHSSSSNSTSMTLLRERLYAFYTGFEEIYQNQTGWSIPNTELRENLRILICVKVSDAYRIFVGRHTNNITEEHMKYTADDLENYILDLFEGAPKSLHSFNRR